MRLLGRNSQLLGSACCQSSCSVSLEAKKQARWKPEIITDCIVRTKDLLFSAGSVFIWCDPYDKQYACTIDLAALQYSSNGKIVEQWCMDSLCCLTRRHPEKLVQWGIHVVKDVTLLFIVWPQQQWVWVWLLWGFFFVHSQHRWKGQSVLCFSFF